MQRHRLPHQRHLPTFFSQTKKNRLLYQAGFRNGKEEVNKEDNPIQWSWDCGLKLDYDGGICYISSRFYPPHKSSEDYGKYHGTISVMIGDAKECLHKQEIEAKTLDELKEAVEDYVSKIIEKIKTSIRNIFNE